MISNLSSHGNPSGTFGDISDTGQWLNRAFARELYRSPLAVEVEELVSDDADENFSAAALRLAELADPGDDSDDQSDSIADGGSRSRETVAAFSDDFSSTDNWVSTIGSMVADRNRLLINASGGFGSVQSKQMFQGAFEMKFDLFLPGAADAFEIAIGDSAISNLTDAVNIDKWSQHSVRVVYDGKNTVSTYLNGSDTAVDTRTDVGELGGIMTLSNRGEGSALLSNLSVTALGDNVILGQEASAAIEESDATIDGAVVGESDAIEEAGPEVGNEFDIEADAEQAEYDLQAALQEILSETGEAFIAQANLDEEDVFHLLES